MPSSAPWVECHIHTIDIAWDPLDKVGRILVLNIDHLLVNLLCAHLPM
ncbi:unnamed protein product [Musa acuminata subsp. malaccensis]|uniref:(wild Malaysian banana) hypothetical protein n=1 Tax=Musa acuminata subsp. malaccensis TaxID=214687 RepID=A0A8D7BCW7_MUSAM|nr:unnamed protein product [Musa acuminata subsp. malaccensis]